MFEKTFNLKCLSSTPTGVPVEVIVNNTKRLDDYLTPLIDITIIKEDNKQESFVFVPK